MALVYLAEFLKLVFGESTLIGLLMDEVLAFKLPAFTLGSSIEFRHCFISLNLKTYKLINS